MRVLTIVAASLAVASVFAQPAPSTDWELHPTGAWSAFVPGSAGAVAQRGDLAFVVMNGLRVLDVSDPSRPSLVGRMEIASEIVDLQAAGIYLCVATKSAGFQVIEVSDPARPRLLSSWSVPDAPSRISRLRIRDNTVFVADSRRGLDIVDITDPSRPALRGSLSAGDRQCFGLDVEIAGRYAYLAASIQGLKIIDLLDPAQPRVVSTLRTQDAAGVARAGNLAFVADSRGGLVAIDVEDPDQPRQLGQLSLSGSAKQVALSGDYAWVATGPEGLQIIDISNPAQLKHVGAHAAGDAVTGVAAAVSRVFVSASRAGLQILDLATPANPLRLALYGKDSYTQGISMAGNLAYLADGPGGFRIIDVSTPARPRQLGQVPAEAKDHASDVAVLHQIAYVSGYRQLETSAEAWLQTIDVSSPASPKPLTRLTFPTPGPSSRIHVAEPYLYVIVTDNSVQIVDISIPESPVLAGSLEPDPEERQLLKDLVVRDGHAFAAANLGGLQVIDVGTPAQPARVWTANAARASRDIVVSGTYALVADRDAGLLVVDVEQPTRPVVIGQYAVDAGFEGVAVSALPTVWAVGPQSGLHAIDVSNPHAPVSVGHFDTTAQAESVVLAGQHAYVADGIDGLRVIRITDRTRPHQVAGYDTPGECHSVAVASNRTFIADGGAGVHILDVADPSQPAWIGSVETVGPAYGIAVANGHAYVAAWDAGLVVIDLSDPAQPRVAARADTLRARRVAVAGSLAYVADQRGGLELFDISQPANPRPAGTFLDMLGFDVPSSLVYDVDVSGSVAALAYGTLGLQLVDITDPAAPRSLGGTPVARFGSGSGVEIAGKHLFLTSFPGIAELGTVLHVYDISKRAQPQLLSSLTRAADSWIYDLTLIGRRAFLAGQGLSVLDLLDPLRPRVERHFELPSPANRLAVQGAYVYLAAGESGLQIHRLHRTIRVAVSESQTLANVTVPRLSDPGLAENLPFHTTDGEALGGVDYVAIQGTVVFAPGQLETSINIPLLNDNVLEPPETFRIDVPGALTSIIVTVLDDGDEPPRFTVTRAAEPGVFQFTLAACAGQSIVIETSPDLKRWTPLSAFTLQVDELEWRHHHNFLDPARYFRAGRLP